MSGVHHGDVVHLATGKQNENLPITKFEKIDLRDEVPNPTIILTQMKAVQGMGGEALGT